MARRRGGPITSLLHNVVATLVTRASDLDGYWIFGFLVEDLTRSAFDLVGHDVVEGSRAWTAFVTLARARFAEQAAHAAVVAEIERAELVLERKGACRVLVGDHYCDGYHVSLAIHAVYAGRAYAWGRTIDVAPHDPTRETRSTRTWAMTMKTSL